MKKTWASWPHIQNMLRVKVSLKPLDDLKEFQNWGTKGTEKEPQLLYKVKVEIVLLHNHKEKLWIASSVFRIVKGKNICRKVDDTTSLLHQKKSCTPNWKLNPRLTFALGLFLESWLFALTLDESFFINGHLSLESYSFF